MKALVLLAFLGLVDCGPTAPQTCTVRFVLVGGVDTLTDVACPSGATPYGGTELCEPIDVGVWCCSPTGKGDGNGDPNQTPVPDWRSECAALAPVTS